MSHLTRRALLTGTAAAAAGGEPEQPFKVLHIDPAECVRVIEEYMCWGTGEVRVLVDGQVIHVESVSMARRR